MTSLITQQAGYSGGGAGGRTVAADEADAALHHEGYDLTGVLEQERGMREKREHLSPRASAGSVERS